MELKCYLLIMVSSTIFFSFTFTRIERRQILQDVNISFNLISHLFKTSHYLCQLSREQQWTKSKSMHNFWSEFPIQSEPW